MSDKTPEQIELETLRASNAALQAKLDAKRNQPLTFKVSEKGGLSVYGMGRFPTTLYRQQWEKLLAGKDDIIAFIAANAGKLTVKE